MGAAACPIHDMFHFHVSFFEPHELHFNSNRTSTYDNAREHKFRISNIKGIINGHCFIEHVYGKLVLVVD